METEVLITYWVESSARDFTTMQHLVEKGDYQWALFIGHLVLEKLLKAYYVKHGDHHPPLSHNLLNIAERAGLTLNPEQKTELNTISTFNIQARYDTYKSDFYALCTKDFTDEWIAHIEEFCRWIKDQLSNP